jgi:hypothetical protein
MQRLKHYGWGREGEGLSAEEEAFVLDRHRHRFGVDSFDERLPPALSDIKLRPPRLAPPPSLAMFSTGLLIATLSRSSIMLADLSATMRTLPMSWPTRATRSRSWPFSNGPARLGLP